MRCLNHLRSYSSSVDFKGRKRLVRPRCGFLQVFLGGESFSAKLPYFVDLKKSTLLPVFITFYHGEQKWMK